MEKILGIGIATVDVINSVDEYPPEDAEVRASAQRIVRGGNVTNTLVVLAQQGHACAWGGVLAHEPDAKRIVQDLHAYGVDTTPVHYLEQGKVPVSYITHSLRNGTRTIVHYRDLPEYGDERFSAVDLTPYHWIHFEGRNVDQTERMLRRARGSGAVVSVEIEKPRAGIEGLARYADVVLLSRAYALAVDHHDGPAALRAMRASAPEADLVCAWGEVGAFALDRHGNEYHAEAWRPEAVVDTLGAGDTFNAGVIDARLRGLDWRDTLQAATRLAGRKCGQVGLDGLGQKHTS
jgi:ketohexokinase